MSHRRWGWRMGVVVGSLSLQHVTYFTVALSQLVLPRNVLRKRKGYPIKSVHTFTISSPVSLPELVDSSHLLQGSLFKKKKKKTEGILSHFKMSRPTDLFVSTLFKAVKKPSLLCAKEGRVSLSLGGLRRLVHTSVTDTLVFGLVRWWREPRAEGSDSTLSIVCVCVCMCVCVCLLSRSVIRLFVTPMDCCPPGVLCH